MRNHFAFILFMLCVCLPGFGQGAGQVSSDPLSWEYLGSWGDRGEAPGQLKEPMDISADPAGSVYIADTGNHRIQKWNNMGFPVTEIGGFGWGVDQFDHPVAVAAENGLDVLVADLYNQRIQRYDKDLHYLASLVSGTDWPEHLRFGFPRDVGLSEQGELFCLDEENHRILKLDVMGTPQISFGGFEAGEGRLVKPEHMCIGPDGRVYVSDTDRKQVVVFDAYGNYLHTIDEALVGIPSAMTGAGGKWLFVLDLRERQIRIFGAGGRPAGVLKTHGGGEPGLEDPVGLASWRDRIYVLDRKRCRVDVFRWIEKDD
jgi:hypothetical protein